ncbi:CMRF35-like molecule 9 isoform X2 [Heterocephalus glaber]|uniref:CMRF35-like molecule 9 isoform X2 n=1 Tax=Heterocephalus glaber TaxID=10181 RepID=A0AAX6RIU1_HETGA|nr:CMRF35-like molecule 9 isoform X2 [Heterocephalus glaber]
MRALALLWGCLALRASAALTCPKEMSGFEGDTVTLRCTYESELRTHPKYWCREVGVFISRCSSKIFSGENSQDVMEGRVSIRDSPGELALVVSLRGLTLKDSGKYWCGAQRLGPDEACPVSLTVVPATAPEATAPEATAPDAAAASPPAGSSRPTTQPDSSSSAVGDPGPASSSHSSMPSSLGRGCAAGREGPPPGCGKNPRAPGPGGFCPLLAPCVPRGGAHPHLEESLSPEGGSRGWSPSSPEGARSRRPLAWHSLSAPEGSKDGASSVLWSSLSLSALYPAVLAVGVL